LPENSRPNITKRRLTLAAPHTVGARELVRCELAARPGGRSHLGGGEPGHGPGQTSPPRPPGGRTRGRPAGHAGQGSRYYPWRRSPRRPEPSPRRYRPAALFFRYTLCWDKPAVTAPPPGPT